MSRRDRRRHRLTGGRRWVIDGGRGSFVPNPPPVFTAMLYSDDTAMVYSDDTAMEYTT